MAQRPVSGGSRNSVRTIISTDMDGTLLGHEDFAFEPALPLIRELNALDIPIVLNTSKTAVEVLSWQAKLGISGPAIVENGSAIINPVGSTADGTGVDALDSMHVYGAQMAELDGFVRSVAPGATNLLQCDAQLAGELTGLAGAQLRAALSRQFSIPLKFDDSVERDAFIQSAQARGLQCKQGGRFLSLQGACDKGATLQHLVADFEQAWQSDVCVVALGDNHNDLGMLQIADLPIVVNTASGHELRIASPTAIYTSAQAPEGWVEGVKAALSRLSIFD